MAHYSLLCIFRAQARHFVHVPQAVAADYDVAPQSTVRLDKNRNNKVRETNVHQLTAPVFTYTPYIHLFIA